MYHLQRKSNIWYLYHKNEVVAYSKNVSVVLTIINE